ncbi:spore germination protein, GerA family [Schinkia azotoformans MEV2011]|uniref:Spore germination protein, GerA family n=1 Tax=Schinkia azotoformans MEV2011 TaxID=1348973 RepID=A0A072NG32_SCHAZ|nr:spore germination protein [Schinkia azotoformans]KEF36187.1 spore germination protein, GerA family [Schinkia azotoformans MEV2011]MEC1695361.1 spore germination protein [Schinkia azotoformans]MEC1726094.1 spore germination protein [Schinkia azotoformans]MEC1779233.1 spore germination protein [Schinkia azotoformans]MED4331020.1 spore germination protein [Schinkia azotoformans]
MDNNSIKEKLQQQFAENIDENVKIIKDILEDSVDLAKREFIFHAHTDIRMVCFYTDGLVNTQEIQNVIEVMFSKTSELIVNSEVGPIKDDITKKMIENLILHPSTKPLTKLEEAIDEILSGNTVFFINGSKEAFTVSTRGWNTRSVDEPVAEQVVRGPRDGFTENVRSNTALVRRRIRDPLFRIEAMKIGTKTKTDINIAYLKGTVKEEVLKEIRSRLQKIKIDSILESGYIEELIEDAPLSPFPTIQSTERPDKVAASILEGRVAIFVDNSPFVLVAPTYFWQFLQASDDYYSRYYTATFYRIVRYIAFLISLTLPSFYVMLASFHQEMIPTSLALTIASGREIVPYPVLLEALIMETAFELMREAGLRMPKPVGQAVSIVGSLIIGQAAVQAGLVSPFMVIVVALTGIASFAIPNYAASFSIRLIRFPLLIASGTMGLLGFAACFSLLAIHAISIRSFGEPYLAPATPFKPSDQKDALIRFPWWKMISQPELAEGQEDRVKENQIPQPPEIQPGKKNEKTDDKADKDVQESKKGFRKPKKLKGEKNE